MGRGRVVRSRRSPSPLSLVRCRREAVASPNRCRSRSRILRHARLVASAVAPRVACERESHVPKSGPRWTRFLRDVNRSEARRSSRRARRTQRQCELRRAQHPGAVRTAGNEVVRTIARQRLSPGLRRRDGRHERRSADVAQAREQLDHVGAPNRHGHRSSQAVRTLPHVAAAYPARCRTPRCDRSDRRATSAAFPRRRLAWTRSERHRHTGAQSHSAHESWQLAASARCRGRRVS